VNPHIIIENIGVSTGGIAGRSGGLTIGTDQSTSIDFRSGCTTTGDYPSTGTERMRIVCNSAASAGGTTGPGVFFSHAGFAIDRGWADYPSITICNTNIAGNTNQGQLRVHGTNCSATSYPSTGGADFSINMQIDGSNYFTSDRRAKSNISSITDALELVMKLDGKRFQRINRDGEIQQHISENGYKYGFIAQDLAAAEMGEMYIHNVDEDDGTENFNNAYCVDYACMVAVLTNAIKQQQAMIVDLQTRIDILEKK
jgi:hypothetical protein